jgi:hypothetical protein
MVSPEGENFSSEPPPGETRDDLLSRQIDLVQELPSLYQKLNDLYEQRKQNKTVDNSVAINKTEAEIREIQAQIAEVGLAIKLYEINS